MSIRRHEECLAAVIKIVLVIATVMVEMYLHTSYNMNLVNDEYETKMIGYEAGCADGTGDPGACHHVGE